GGRRLPAHAGADLLRLPLANRRVRRGARPPQPRLCPARRLGVRQLAPTDFRSAVMQPPRINPPTVSNVPRVPTVPSSVNVPPVSMPSGDGSIGRPLAFAAIGLGIGLA